MFPYENMEARAHQKIEGYRAEARRHRQAKEARESTGRLDQIWPVVRDALGRSGLGRIGSVLRGRESGPILPAT